MPFRAERPGGPEQPICRLILDLQVQAVCRRMDLSGWHKSCVYSMKPRQVAAVRFSGPRREPAKSRGAAGLQQALRLTGETIMLYWAMVFLIIALVAGILGFTGVYLAAAGIAKVLFFVFLVLFLISLISGGISRRSM
jgi:uncharacterized membrane protein YtjA (UPF0391 family)